MEDVGLCLHLPTPLIHYTLFPSFRSSHSFCSQGVFRPVVFRVTGKQFFADLKIGSFPETFQILGDLDGFVSGGK